MHSALQSQWRQLKPATQPPSWRGSSLVFDKKRQQGVLVAAGTTWLWDGTNWSQARSRHAPPARNTTHLVYDTRAEGVLLFGGIGLDGSPLNDLWLWDGTDWSERPSASPPPPLGGAAMACDTSTGHVLLCGGLTTSADLPGANRTGTFSDRTWLWDGTNWTEVAPGQLPPARVGAQLVYDEGRQQTLLFGGHNATGYLNDMWHWHGNGWEQLTPATLPPPTMRSCALFHAQLQQVLLLAEQPVGTNPLQHTLQIWTWDGTSWSQSAPDQLLPGSIEGCAYDSQRDTLVAYLVSGGKPFLADKQSSAVLPDLAAPTLTSQTWTWNTEVWQLVS